MLTLAAHYNCAVRPRSRRSGCDVSHVGNDSQHAEQAAAVAGGRWWRFRRSVADPWRCSLRFEAKLEGVLRQLERARWRPRDWRNDRRCPLEAMMVVASGVLCCSPGPASGSGRWGDRIARRTVALRRRGAHGARALPATSWWRPAHPRYRPLHQRPISVECAMSGCAHPREWSASPTLHRRPGGARRRSPSLRTVRASSSPRRCGATSRPPTSCDRSDRRARPNRAVSPARRGASSSRASSSPSRLRGTDVDSIRPRPCRGGGGDGARRARERSRCAQRAAESVLDLLLPPVHG